VARRSYTSSIAQSTLRNSFYETRTDPASTCACRRRGTASRSTPPRRAACSHCHENRPRAASKQGKTTREALRSRKRLPRALPTSHRHPNAFPSHGRGVVRRPVAGLPALATGSRGAAGYAGWGAPVRSPAISVWTSALSQQKRNLSIAPLSSSSTPDARSSGSCFHRTACISWSPSACPPCAGAPRPLRRHEERKIDMMQGPDPWIG
jgi:hypothetical protein